MVSAKRAATGSAGGVIMYRPGRGARDIGEFLKKHDIEFDERYLVVIPLAPLPGRMYVLRSQPGGCTLRAYHRLPSTRASGASKDRNRTS